MFNQIKLQLLLKGVKQVDIARKAGVNRSYISLVVNGKEKPSKKVREAFKHFGIELEK
jgi:transcriptional regulator with XRE-family HTH domain